MTFFIATTLCFLFLWTRELFWGRPKAFKDGYHIALFHVERYLNRGFDAREAIEGLRDETQDDDY